MEYMVKVRGQFKRRSTANNVEIYVPVPDDADSPKFRVCPHSRKRGELTSRRVWDLWCMLLKRVHLYGRSSSWVEVGIT